VELGGRRGATAAAIINTGGNGIGLLAPQFTPIISAHFGWQWGIAMGGVVGLLGALCWCGIDPTRATPNNRPDNSSNT
jgi:MFS family permease